MTRRHRFKPDQCVVGCVVGYAALLLGSLGIPLHSKAKVAKATPTLSVHTQSATEQSLNSVIG